MSVLFIIIYDKLSNLMILCMPVWQPVQADSQPKSSGLVLGRRPLGAILHSSDEPGELSQWLCHDDSTINVVVLIIIIIIIDMVSAFRNKHLSVHCRGSSQM